MTLGAILENDSLPLMSEGDAIKTLRRARHIYNVPTEWDGETDSVLVFTADPTEAAYCADVLARQDIGTSYRSYVGTGVDVEGPHEVVLVGVPETEWVDWRYARDVFTTPPRDDHERARRYSLFMCRVSSARDQRADHMVEITEATAAAVERGRS